MKKNIVLVALFAVVLVTNTASAKTLTNAQSPYTALGSANYSTTHATGSDQYCIKVNKNDAIKEITVTIKPNESGEYWLPTGTEADVSVEYKDGYLPADSKYKYEVNDATELACEPYSITSLTLTGWFPFITKVRAYKDSSNYVEYTDFNNMQVWPGQTVIIYHMGKSGGSSYGDALRSWYYYSKSGDMVTVGNNTTRGVYFVVPSNATGAGYLHTAFSVDCISDGFYFSSNRGWCTQLNSVALY